MATNLIWASATRADRAEAALALTLAKDMTIPVQALEIEETLAHMTRATLMHPHHTVDAFFGFPHAHLLPSHYAIWLDS